MRRGQGSLEYLLVLAAILAIAVVVVLVANSMLGTPQEASIVNEDKYAFALNGIEVIGYDQIYDGTEATAPTSLIIDGESYDYVFGAPDPGVSVTAVGSISNSDGGSSGVSVGDDGNFYIEEVIPLTCGDGTEDAGEECDDGNNDDGDCCSSTCIIEPVESITCGLGICEVTVDHCYEGVPMECMPGPPVYMSETELPFTCDDGEDSDCDGLTDCDDPDCDLDPACTLPETCTDGDEDGFELYNAVDCPTGDDCDDGNINIYPGATEVCSNGIDEDCSGSDLPCAGTVLNTCGETIAIPGNYFLTDDWNCPGYGLIFTPEAKGSSLNCQNKHITRDTSGGGVGIDLTAGVNDTLFTNCGFSNFRYGFRIWDSDNVTITDSIMDGNSIGMHAHESENFTAISNTVINSDDTFHAVSITNTDNVTFIGNNISYNAVAWGVMIRFATEVKFRDNVIMSNTNIGLQIQDGDDSTIMSGNKWCSNTNFDVYCPLELIVDDGENQADKKSSCSGLTVASC